MFELVNLKPFLIYAAVQAFENDADMYADTVFAALLIVKNKAGLSDDDLTDKHVLPAAWITSYIYMQRYDSMNQDLINRTESLYKKALEMLSSQTKTVNSSRVGQIEGLMP